MVSVLFGAVPTLEMPTIIWLHGLNVPLAFVAGWWVANLVRRLRRERSLGARYVQAVSSQAKTPVRKSPNQVKVDGVWEVAKRR